jgi:hypothetical protein
MIIKLFKGFRSLYKDILSEVEGLTFQKEKVLNLNITKYLSLICLGTITIIVNVLFIIMVVYIIIISFKYKLVYPFLFILFLLQFYIFFEYTRK